VDRIAHNRYGAWMNRRLRLVAHVGSVELLTPTFDDSLRFFVDLMGMDEVGRRGDSVYLHTWDDYERFTIKLTASDTSGVGRTYLRAASAEALDQLVDRVSDFGAGTWVEDELGLGPVYLAEDPDGHRYGLYWETERYVAPPELKPALKNQAARFPGRGANVRRLDHVNFLASDVVSNSDFVGTILGALRTEQILTPEGPPAATWVTFSDMS